MTYRGGDEEYRVLALQRLAAEALQVEGSHSIIPTLLASTSA